MKTYFICTDSGSETIEASNIKQALQAWGEAPASVTTPARFEEWLEKLGGYGFITEDDTEIARVED
jgi:hypothetical protein